MKGQRKCPLCERWVGKDGEHKCGGAGNTVNREKKGRRAERDD